MKAIKPEVFRKHRASDLTLVAEILKREKICLDTSSIHDAASMCREPKTDMAWGYSLSGLSFKFKAPKKTQPKNLISTLDLELSVNLEGHCDNSGQWDCLNSLTVELEITGRKKDDRQLLCAWHFDRHLWSEGDGEPQEIHPLYHCHHGGRRMIGLEEFGDILLLNSPRLAHPPMDALLAIDFVLANFLPNEWKALRNENTYKNRLYNSQKLILVPYFESLLSEIKNQNGSHPSHLWPMN